MAEEAQTVVLVAAVPAFTEVVPVLADLVAVLWGLQECKSLTINASKSSTKRKEHTLPVMSPWDTKKVTSFLKGILPRSTAGSHQGVVSKILPDGLIMALMPVFAQRAIALRVSMARKEA